MELSLKELNVLIHGCDLLVAKAVSIIEDPKIEDKGIVEAYTNSMTEAHSILRRLAELRLEKMEEQNAKLKHAVISPMDLNANQFLFQQILALKHFDLGVKIEGVELLDMHDVMPGKVLQGPYNVEYSKIQYQALLSVLNYMEASVDGQFNTDNPFLDIVVSSVSEFNLCNGLEQMKDLYLSWVNEYKEEVQLRIDML